MLIGLYSATARRVVKELSADPAFPGAGCDDATLRNFRRRLMDRPERELGGELKLSPDFYTTSEFRDLACHVYERCVFLSEIRNFVDLNSLAFKGFWIDPRLLEFFHEKCPNEPWPGRLEVWEKFEQANPQIFGGMYHFWCEKHRG